MSPTQEWADAEKAAHRENFPVARLVDRVAPILEPGARYANGFPW